MIGTPYQRGHKMFTPEERKLVKGLQELSVPIGCHVSPIDGSVVFQIDRKNAFSITPDDLRTWVGLLAKYADIASGFAGTLPDDMKSYADSRKHTGTIQVRLEDEE